MFEVIDYAVSEERRNDFLKQAEAARMIRSLEIPGRRVRPVFDLGSWFKRSMEIIAALFAAGRQDHHIRKSHS